MEEKIIKYRWPLILLTLLLTAVSGSFIFRVSTETDMKKFIPDDMGSMVRMDSIESIFGGTDMIAILLETEDVLEPATLERVRQLSRGFSRIQGIDRVISLFDTKDIYGEYGTMIVDPAVRYIPENPEEREALRERLLNNDLARGVVVSEDFRYTLIMGTVREEVGDESLIAEVEALLEAHPGNEQVHRGGMPYIREHIDHDIRRDMAVLLPVALVLMLLILYLAFREIRGVLLPFSVVILSIVFSMGLIPLLGWKLSIISILLPIMMIAIANNYGIHIIARYQEISRSQPAATMKGIVVQVIRRLRYPVLLTGLTTVAGILGLLAHTIIPARQLGVVAAVGIAFALAISLFYIPALLSMLKKKNPEKDRRHPWLENGLKRTGRWIATYPRRVMAGSGILVLAMAAGMLLIEVDTNIENFFPEHHPVKVSSRIINEEFGGSQNIAVMFEGDIKSPALLQRLDRYEEELKDHPGVGQVYSIATILREMGKALNDPGDPLYDRIPDTRAAVAQYLELYAMSGEPEDFEQFVNFDYTRALLIVRLDDASNAAIKGILNRIDELSGDDPARAMVGGYALTTVELADLVVRGQTLSLIYAVIVVALLLMLIFRSAAAGITSVIPLGFAIIFLFGLMGLLGIRLDIVTAMLSSIMIGVGIDYTIHYLWRYRDELAGGKTPADALVRTLSTTGRGILFNAFSVMIGFSVLFLSSFAPIRLFGFLIVVSIFTCLLGAMVIVPAVLLVWKPAFLEKKTLMTKKIQENEKDDHDTDDGSGGWRRLASS